MRDMLDAMQQLMTGGSTYFDTAHLEELAECWENTNPDLIQANDEAWRGLAEFFNSDGYGTDPRVGDDTNFKEDNTTVQDYLGMVIYEPCNYASNMAYVHLATEIVTGSTACPCRGTLPSPSSSPNPSWPWDQLHSTDRTPT